MTNKKANTIYPVNDLLAKRWSPRSFSGEKLKTEDVYSLFEAARWAASSYNEQPWRFIAGINFDETWGKIYDTLLPGNKT